MATDGEDVKKSVFVQNGPSSTNINTLIYIQIVCFYFKFLAANTYCSIKLNKKIVYVIHIFVFLVCSLKSTGNYSQGLKVEILDRNRESYFASIKMVSYLQRSFKHHIKAEIYNVCHHKMDESSSILFCLSCTDNIR